MMLTCYENHPTIIFECLECPLCLVLDGLWGEPKLKASLKVKLDELERPMFEKAEKDLKESLTQLKIDKKFTKEGLNEMFKNQMIGQFEAPFAGEYKQTKSERGEE